MNRQTLSFVLAAAVVVVGVLVLISLTLESSDNETSNSSDPPPDLLQMMVLSERFLEKTHLAASAGNWELATFYAHELEELAEDLRDADVRKNDVELTPLARDAFLPSAEALYDAARDQDADSYWEAYRAVVSSCNACHTASGYEFIRIQEPASRQPYAVQRVEP